MIKSAQRVTELAAIGVHTPPRPQPPFEVVPGAPIAEDSVRDAEYQAACAAWTEAVACLYAGHFSSAEPGQLSGLRD